MTRLFVIDTSYLTELYRVPGYFEQSFAQALAERLQREVDGRFYVPVGCLYKLCDHISDVQDWNQRRRLGELVARDVRSSSKEARPWIVRRSSWMASSSTWLKELSRSVQAFASDPSRLHLNLTNSETIDIAENLKGKYRTLGQYRVHIWTRHNDLKAREPDTEPNPLL